LVVARSNKGLASSSVRFRQIVEGILIMSTLRTHKKIKIAVVGGEIGELLKYLHLNVGTYEAGHRFSEAGARVALWPNARRALGLLIGH
jgi:hypothetical protein